VFRAYLAVFTVALTKFASRIFPKSGGMNKYNKKTLEKTFIEHVFNNPITEQPMSYSEMRGFYG
jgi:amino acid transporter